MRRTMRIKIGTALYKKLITCLERGHKWDLEGRTYNITGAKRADNSDYVRVELDEVRISCR